MKNEIDVRKMLGEGSILDYLVDGGELTLDPPKEQNNKHIKWWQKYKSK